MDFRSNRGGSAMNRYDDNIQTYDPGKKLKDACCNRCARGFLLWINVGFSVLAFVVIGVGIGTYTTGHVAYVGEVNSVLFALALVLGILMLVISVLGCITAKTKSQCLLIIYVIGLCLAMIFEIVLMSFAFNPQHLRGLIKQRWDNMSTAQQSKLEQDLNCCGFDGPSSSNTHSGSWNSTALWNASMTTTTSGCPGCYSVIEKSLKSVQVALGVLAILMLLYELFMFGFSVMLFWARRSDNKKEKVGDDLDNGI